MGVFHLVKLYENFCIILWLRDVTKTALNFGISKFWHHCAFNNHKSHVHTECEVRVVVSFLSVFVFWNYRWNIPKIRPYDVIRHFPKMRPNCTFPDPVSITILNHRKICFPAVYNTPIFENIYFSLPMTSWWRHDDVIGAKRQI